MANSRRKINRIGAAVGQRSVPIVLSATQKRNTCPIIVLRDQVLSVLVSTGRPPGWPSGFRRGHCIMFAAYEPLRQAWVKPGNTDYMGLAPPPFFSSTWGVRDPMREALHAGEGVTRAWRPSAIKVRSNREGCDIAWHGRGCEKERRGGEATFPCQQRRLRSALDLLCTA
ncbi:hypothetical protein GQ53DRAFT_271596 [Thozetella sp. PMI_491]|nr:hypothetical protein GQ53DRAFT_271596 [Thozetella sp. PMI_491]